MRNQARIWLATGISLFVLTSATRAQEEQRLQYHPSREPQQKVDYMGASASKVTSEKPQGVELPDFKCDEPVFARWSTAMVASGGLWMAFDRIKGTRILFSCFSSRIISTIGTATC